MESLIEDIIDDVIYDRLANEEYNGEYKNKLKKMWTDLSYMENMIVAIVKDDNIKDFLRSVVNDYTDKYLDCYKEETHE